MITKNRAKEKRREQEKREKFSDLLFVYFLWIFFKQTCRYFLNRNTNWKKLRVGIGSLCNAFFSPLLEAGGSLFCMGIVTANSNHTRYNSRSLSQQLHLSLSLSWLQWESTMYYHGLGQIQPITVVQTRFTALSPEYSFWLFASSSCEKFAQISAFGTWSAVRLT